MRFVFVAFFLLTLVFPFQADAQLFGPVISEACKCENSAPTFGCVLQTIQNLLNLAITIGVVIATFMIAYAGFLWVLSPTDPKNKEKGRGLLINSVIGLVLILSSWLLVDTFMKVFYDQEGTGWGPWNEIILEGETGSACFIPRAQQQQTSSDDLNGDGTPDRIACQTGVEGNRCAAFSTYPHQHVTGSSCFCYKNQSDIPSGNGSGGGAGIQIRVGDNVQCGNNVNGIVTRINTQNSRIEVRVSAGSPPQISVATANTCTVVTAGGGTGGSQNNPPTLTQTQCNPGTTCVNLLDSNSGVPCTRRTGNTCLVVPDLHQRLWRFNQAFDPEWTVYEAWDNGGHSNSCHRNATCVDFDFLNNASPTAAQIQTMIETARNNSLYACWEVGSTQRRQALISDGLPPEYVDTVTGVGEHASFYMTAPTGGTCNRGTN